MSRCFWFWLLFRRFGRLRVRRTDFESDDKIVGGYGQLVDRPLKIDRLFDEHGIVLGDHSVRTGDKLWVIPGHVGTCVNQHDTVWYGRDGKVEGKWTVAARGRVQ